ncbi:MAG: trigger factor [Candidatus Buchananbacteria bacterium]|jgi:trigger factor
MKSVIKKLPKSLVEISVEVSVGELLPFMKKTAVKISETTKIEGFRPGKAPYDIIKAKFGDMAILQEAIDDIIMKTYYEVIKENKLVTLGQPQIDVEKIAPENPFAYKATVSILPSVKVADPSTISLKREEIKVTDEQVEKIIEEIRAMRSKENKVEREAKLGDLVKLDFNVYRDGVPIENGGSQNYSLLLGENRFIPGFEDNLVGLKAGEEKEFKLNFPETYHEKSLAGKPAEFKVKINEVAEIIKSEVTDELAKEISGGAFSGLDELKENIKTNVALEESNKQEKKLEVEMLELLANASEFEDLPEMLVHEEIHRMLHELQDNISKQGMKFDDYLTAIKKTVDDLEKEMEPQAALRVKTSIIAREIYNEQKMEVTPDEVEKEISEILKNYPEKPDVRKQIETETYKEYLKNAIGNKKVMDYLKNIIIK